ncbi:hypothetical protein [Candidatus Vondammii sp. HM_W22]|nr:hypothetical protein [Candidatus Vondammii sp. HM_W22]
MSKISSYDQFKSKTTLKKTLTVAIEFERAARDFYSDLIPKVSRISVTL